MKKQPRLKFSKVIFFLLFATALGFVSSCKKLPDIQKEEPVDTKECSTYGTLVYMPCWWSAYNNFWIRLDDGTLMRPCETMIQTICPLNLQEGQRVKFGYEISDCNFDQANGPLCCFIPEYPPAQPNAKSIRITCFEIVEFISPPATCKFNGVVRKFQNETCGVKLVEFTDPALPGQLQKIEPVNQDLLSNLNEGDQITFNYNPVETFAITCSGEGAAEITCLNSQVNPGDCKPLVITNALSTGDPINSIMIKSVYVEGNCLKIVAGYSGCDDNVSRFDLVWDGNVMESNPVQINMVVTDYGQITCAAYFENTLSFDLSKLKETINGPVYINITGWPTPVLVN